MAQTPFRTIDSLNVNNINASVLVHGDMWWNANDTQYVHKCFFPKGSRKNISFAGSIWLSALDGAGKLHVSAQTYRQDGNDYWPGPLDNADTLTYATSHNWAHIWKISRTDVQYFQGLFTHTIANTPASILTWPGKGNANATGNAGAVLTVTTDMAPFNDLNSNGIYEPLLGEYPDFKGDQALWWVFSDNGPSRATNHKSPLGIEIHAMSYGYKRGTTIDNVVYYEYTMVNRSGNNYTGMRFGQWDDVDLGYGLDDYIGFDSAWRLGICYNATNCDGCFAGTPANAYGSNPPVMGITMIAAPGDAGTSYVPAGSFFYYNNDNSILGNPGNDTECYNYMHSKLKNGQSYGTFRMIGAPLCGNFDTNASINYVYPADPSLSTGWSECACNNYQGDRKFILSTRDFNLNSGGTQKVLIGLLAADSAGGCGSTNFAKIKTVADTAWNVYHHPPGALPFTGITQIGNNEQISLYPNPAHSQLIIEGAANQWGDMNINLFNTLGQKIKTDFHVVSNHYEADISKLETGLYYVSVLSHNSSIALKFIKE